MLKSFSGLTQQLFDKPFRSMLYGVYNIADEDRYILRYRFYGYDADIDSLECMIFDVNGIENNEMKLFKKYIETERARQEYYKNSGMSIDEIERTSYCNNGVCLNSRVDTNAYTTISDEIIEAEGGYDAFVKKYMINGYDLGENGVQIATNEDGTTKYNSDGTVSVIVDRDWTLTEKQQSGGYDHDGNSATPAALFFPIVVEVEVTYPCEIPDPPVYESCNISSNSFGAGCGGGSGSSEYTKDYSYTYYTGTVSNEDELALCSAYAAGSSGRETAKAIAKFTQTGSLNFSYTKQIYAGGGVSIRASYNNQASWNYCVDNEQTEPIMCTTHEEYLPYCTGSGYKLDVDEGICVKTIKEEMTEEECDREDGRYSSKTGTCRITETKDYKCGWKAVSVNTPSGCYDYSPAEDEFAKRAANEYQKGESGKIEAPDSNDVDGGNVLLSAGGADSPGSLSGPSGSVGSSWEPGNVVSTTMRFSLNDACINIYTARVTYRTSGCTDDEIDGYSLYYVPLKMKDNSNFTIDISEFQLSSLAKYRDWNWDANCSVKVQQRLYGENRFVYRPIDLRPYNADDKKLSVFPKNKKPSLNWEYFWSDNSRVEKEMTREPLEYHGILSQTAINSIKNYNVYGYSDLKTISHSGKSTILDGLGIEWVNNKDFVEYNELGKCEKDCW